MFISTVLNNRTLKRAVQAIFSLVILSLLVYQLSQVQDSLWEVLERLSLWHVLVLVIGYLGLQVLSAYKWLGCARSMGLHGSLSDYVRFYFIGMFASLFLPTAMGGDVIRAWMAAKLDENQANHLAQLETDTAQGRTLKQHVVQGSMAILAERWTGFALILFFMALGAVQAPPDVVPVWLKGIMVLGTLVYLVMTFQFKYLVRWKPLKRLLFAELITDDSGSTPAFSYWPGTPVLWWALGVSLVFHLGSLTLQWWILDLLGSPIELWVLTLVYGLPAMASLFPLAFNGLGVREASAVGVLLAFSSTPKHVALVFSLIWLMVLMIAACPGGLLWLKSGIKKIEAMPVAL